MTTDRAPDLIADEGQLRPSPDVVARRLDRAGVLVHLPTNRIFELNETGIRVWELIAGGHHTRSVVDHLVREYDVDVVQASGETRELIAEFRREGFVA